MQYPGDIYYQIYIFLKNKCSILETIFGLWHSILYKESYTILCYTAILYYFSL